MENANKHRKIVVGVDFSACGARALSEAGVIARANEGTELHAVTVIPGKESKTSVDQETALETARERLTTMLGEHLADEATDEGRRVVAHVAIGAPVVQIIQLAADLHADLLVVGTHARTGVERMLLGSVAEAVIRNAPCPVLVARPRDYTAGVPEIEPACPDCLEVQRESAGAKLWCERHSVRRARAHTYYSRDRVSESIRPSQFGAGR